MLGCPPVLLLVRNDHDGQINFLKLAIRHINDHLRLFSEAHIAGAVATASTAMVVRMGMGFRRLSFV